MKQTSLKSIARHLAAVQSGKVDKTNVIGIRKAINEWSETRTIRTEIIDALFELECAIRDHPPTVAGALHDSGLKVLRNPRYAKRWTDLNSATSSINADHFELVRFDRVGMRGRYSMPVYRVVSYDGRSFTFRNIPWQTAYYSGLDDGPRVVDDVA
jgi:hypothetical protein